MLKFVEKYLPEFHFFDHPKIVLAAGFTWATGASFFDKYIFDDWQYFIFLLIAVAINTASGILKAIKMKNFCFSKMDTVLVKLVLYSFVLVAVHGIRNYSQAKGVGDTFAWLKEAIYFGILFREFLRTTINVEIILPGLLPKFILKRLKEFDENGNFKISEQ